MAILKEVDIPNPHGNYQYDAIFVLGASMVWDESRGKWNFPTIIPGTSGVVAGGNSRALAAAQALAENLAPLVLVTGGSEQQDGKIGSRAEELRNHIIRRGGNPSRVVAIGNENVPRGNTLGNMDDIREYLQEHPEIQRIAIITNDFHIPRAFVFAQAMLPSYIRKEFLGVNALLVRRDARYQHWVDALSGTNELKRQEILEASGIDAWNAGLYHPTHE